MSTAAERECRACGSCLRKSRFSANQWRKGRGSSRCRDCIAADTPAELQGSPSKRARIAVGWLTEQDDDKSEGVPYQGISIVSKILPKEEAAETQDNMQALHDNYMNDMQKLQERAEAIGASLEIKPPDMTLAECLSDMCSFSCVNWSSVVNRINSHPAETREVIRKWDNEYGEEGENVCPLHIFLRFNTPLVIVKALVRANPDAFDRRQYPETPLRRACENDADSQLICYLLDATLRADRHYGIVPATCNPIGFIARGNTRVEVIELLLDKYPAGVKLAGGEALCPLDRIIFTNHSFFEHSVFDKLPHFLNAVERVPSIGRWQPHVSTFRPLHSLLRWILRPDSPTDLPIGIMEPGDGVVRLARDWLENCPEVFRETADDGSFPIHTLLSGRWPHPPLSGKKAGQLVVILIEGAAGSEMKPTADGRLPLHLALENEWPDECVERILDLFPGALETRDPTTNLLPFQIAALKSELTLLGYCAPANSSAENDEILRQIRREEEAGLLSRRTAHQNTSNMASTEQLRCLNRSYSLLLKDPTLVLAAAQL